MFCRHCFFGVTYFHGVRKVSKIYVIPPETDSITVTNCTRAVRGQGGSTIQANSLTEAKPRGRASWPCVKVAAVASTAAAASASAAAYGWHRQDLCKDRLPFTVFYSILQYFTVFYSILQYFIVFCSFIVFLPFLSAFLGAIAPSKRPASVFMNAFLGAIAPSKSKKHYKNIKNNKILKNTKKKHYKTLKTL